MDFNVEVEYEEQTYTVLRVGNNLWNIISCGNNPIFVVFQYASAPCKNIHSTCLKYFSLYCN